MKAEQGKDLKTEVDGLAEMVEYMTVVTEDGKTVSAGMVTNSELLSHDFSYFWYKKLHSTVSL